jgi:hypothetical protein
MKLIEKHNFEPNNRESDEMRFTWVGHELMSLSRKLNQVIDMLNVLIGREIEP